MYKGSSSIRGGEGDSNSEMKKKVKPAVSLLAGSCRWVPFGEPQKSEFTRILS